MTRQSKTIGRVQLAMERLVSDMPFHAGILFRWRLIEDGASTQTMAIGFRAGRFTLHLNPDFVGSLSMDELGAVLSHEVGHVLFGHVFQEPSLTENRQARVVSQETVVNDWAIGPLPGKPILTDDFDVLSCSQSTDERYDLLKDIVSDTVVVIAIDDHGAWEQIRRNGDLAKLTGVLDASSVWSKLTPEQQKAVRLPQTVQKRLEAAGVLDGKADAAIGRGTASVPWQRVLRGYVGREFRRCPTYSRPSRRLPLLYVGIVPGAARQSGRPRILSVIDTSGSITSSLLSAISAELAAMSRMYTVIVAECDTKVHAVYPYKPIQTVHGRGGTDLRPPFEAGFLRQHRPDLLIYYSDGCGKAPEVPPSIPVIWCLTPSGRMPSTWGREVRMG